MHSIIYALSDPRTQEIRYVGKTVHGLTRAESHWKTPRVRNRRDRCHNWIRSLLEKNLIPKVVILEECSPELLSERECYWISKFSNLLNMTPGGEGFPLSEEAKQKISVSLIGNTRRRGKKLSEATRQKISEATKGRPKSPEWRAKVGALISAGKRAKK